MAYNHGIKTSEVKTAIVPPVETVAGLPVVFGTAPVHLAKTPAKANEPVLCYSFRDAVEALGYSDDWEQYTLCEFMYAYFVVYKLAPVVLVNVLDVAKHTEQTNNKDIAIKDGVGIIDEPALLDTLQLVTKQSGGTTFEKGTEYEVAHDDQGRAVVTIVDSAKSKVEGAKVYASYKKLNPSAVTKTEVIGGVDVSTGEAKGVAVVDTIFSRFGLVPAQLLAPGWTHEPDVAAVMEAAARSICGLFRAIVHTDVPTDTVQKYSDVAAWKNKNNYTSENMTVCWPMVTLGGKRYHMSTHVAGVIGVVDAVNGDIPYESPSNKRMQADGLALKDGTPVQTSLDTANYLNGNGIVTALNFIGGWRLWGNETGCYPANTDPKDRFICVRRMFNNQATTVILTYFKEVDGPITRQLIERIQDSENIRLNGLVAAGALLAGRMEFRKEDNPKTSLLNGKIKFHTLITPPLPAREIEDVFEFDTDALDTLFK